MQVRLATTAVGAAVLGGAVVAAAALILLPPDARIPFVLLALLLLAAAGAVAARLAMGLAVPLRRSHEQVAAAAETLIHPDAPDVRLDAFPVEALSTAMALRQVQAAMRSLVAQRDADRAQTRAILQQMVDGLLVISPEERILVANPAASDLLRQNRLRGRRAAEAIRDAEIIDVVRAAEPEHPVSRVVELHPGPAQPRQWLNVVATRLPEQRGTLVVLRDVTDLRRAEAARRDFVANISHDLTTPISALKALAETLEGGALEDPAEAQGFITRIHVEVDRLAHMVSELLELARVEAGRMDLDFVPAEVSDLLEEAVERVRAYAARVDVTVRVDPATEPGLVALADGRRIGQVLANLLANALKFTPPGGLVQVGARGRSRDVEIWVADSGIGIDPENLVRVFERFYRADPSRTGSGTGLGLAICKHMVQAHGGRIWAESPGPGRGATFRFTLPRVTADSRAASAAESAGTNGPTPGPAATAAPPASPTNA